MNVLTEVLILLCKMVYYYLEAFCWLFVSPSAKSIRGQLALVTGGGRGIGQRIALELAKHGAKIAVLDLDEVVI